MANQYDGTVSNLRRRFEAKTKKGPGCWLWAGARDGYGYGKLMWRRRVIRASRVAFFLKHGRWPSNALHGCDNPACVRLGQKHVHEGSQRENMQEAILRGRKHGVTPKDANALRRAARRNGIRATARSSGFSRNIIQSLGV